MSNPRHISVRQIAEQAGVSHATVSLALRGSTRISAATRDNVRKVAKGMGWRPNPAVATWMAHRRSISLPDRSEGIVFLNSWPDPKEWARLPWMTRYVDGARARAEELGYGFEEVYCAGLGGGRRLQNMLSARGVRGVLIGSRHRDSPEHNLDWGRLAAVAQSYTMIELKVSRSMNNYYLSMRTAIAELRALGYRRIGYACAPELEERTVRINVSAYLGCQSQFPQKDQLRLLKWNQFDPKALERWLERERPDVLLSHDIRFEEILAGMGVRVPDDLGLALLSIHPGWEAMYPQYNGLAGIDQRLERCGSVALELLVSHLTKNELGLVEEPVLALTAGVWVPGRTVKAR